MKKILISLGFLLGFVAITQAAPDVEEESMHYAAAASSVSISTSAWTVVPTTSGLNYRSGIKVNNPSTNNASVVGILSRSASPSDSITVHPIEIEPGENPFIPCGDDLYLYLLSLHTSAEYIHVQEVRQ